MRIKGSQSVSEPFTQEYVRSPSKHIEERTPFRMTQAGVRIINATIATYITNTM